MSVTRSITMRSRPTCSPLNWLMVKLPSGWAEAVPASATTTPAATAAARSSRFMVP